MSAAFDGMYNFHSWNISHEFTDAIMKYGMSIKNVKAKELEREISEIVGKINSGMQETKVLEHIVGIIVPLKRRLLQIEEG